jgi:hypothetical protein
MLLNIEQGSAPVQAALENIKLVVRQFELLVPSGVITLTDN